MHSLNSAGKLVNQIISNLSYPKDPNGLYEPVKYVLSLGGKRIRPALSILSCELFSKNIDDVVNPAIGLEIFHNFTLIHDDIMDNAPIRRGKPTVHIKWNPNTGILSGDAMMIIAYDMVCKSPANVLPSVLNLFNKTALEVCEGQQYDMDFEIRNNVSESEYMKMIRLKTAVLIAASLKLGGIIGKADDETCDLLYEFGIALGLAFQLQDDWLDSFGSEDSFGKRIGGDIVENKKTMLLIKALQLADKTMLKNLQNLLSATEFFEQTKIDSVLTIYKELKIDTLVLGMTNDYFSQARNLLNELKKRGHDTTALVEFIDSLQKRNH